jgi:prepilin-type N-terminal cleavage/methylation domain-containing protein
MRWQSGFTLVEVMVAIVIGALVILGAHQVFSGVAAGTHAVAEARERLDRASNGRRWLKATFLSLEPPFEGRSHRAAFTSWQLAPGGWFEPKPVVLFRDGDRFVGTIDAQQLELADSVSELMFDYLLTPGANSRWVPEWMSPVSAPLAIRIRIAGCGRGDSACVDTLLFLVKERG